jgi:tRNA(Ile)-lysidine synthase
VEARARAVRYQALEAIRVERGLSLIATAHTADDQAETLLMRLLRGTALRGAAGVREVRGRVIRPMLRLRRADARGFLQDRRVGWREDPMNGDPAFLRVRVRRALLPALAALAGGDPTGRLSAFASQAAEDDAFLSELARAARGRLSGPEGLDAVAVRALAGPIRRRLWVLLLEAQGISSSQERVAQAERAVQAGGRVELVRGQVLDARGGWVRWEEAAPRALGEVWLAQGGRVVFGAFEVGASERPPPQARWMAPVRPAAFPLRLRGRRTGDRIQTGGHARKLQDVLVDAKVPRERRDALPVACDAAGTAFWVAGVPLGPPAPEPGDWWIWARPAAEASEEAGPSL